MGSDEASSRRGAFWDVVEGRADPPPAAVLLGWELVLFSCTRCRRRGRFTLATGSRRPSAGTDTRPEGWVVAFKGTWHGAVLPIADTDNSFTAGRG